MKRDVYQHLASASCFIHFKVELASSFHITQCIKLLVVPDLTSCKDTEVTLWLNISKTKHNSIIISIVLLIA